MTTIGHATLNVVPSTKGFASALNSELGPIGNPSSPTNRAAGSGIGAGILAGLKGFVGPAMIATGALAVGNFIKGSISAAGDLQQSTGAIEAVFKGSAASMVTFGEGAAKAFGLTRHEVNELGTVLGTQLKNGGTALDELAPKTQNLIGVGADLAAMFGGTTADAVGALSSALKGERDPIERYGVSLNQAAIDAKAASMGFEKVGGSLSAEANQAATLALIMEQTADAHGTAAREANTLQARQQQMAAGWENLQAKIGGLFLPAAAAVVGVFADILNGAGPLLDTVGPALAAFFANPAFAQLGAALATILPNLSPVGLAFQALAPVLPQIGALLGQIAEVLAGNLTLAAQALQPVLAAVADVLSGVLAAILPVIAELFTALTPTLSMAAQMFAELATMIAPVITTIADFLMPVIEALLPVVKVVFETVGNIVKGVMNVIQGVIKTVMAVIRGDWSGAWDGLKSILKGAWDIIVAAVQGAIKLVVEVFTGLLPAINRALVGIGTWLVETGRDLVDGLLKGIGEMAGAVWDTLVGLVEDAVGGVLNFLGIHSPSRLFAGIGENVGKGLVNGLDGMKGDVADAALGLSQAATDGFGSPDLTASSRAIAGDVRASGGLGAQVADALTTARSGVNLTTVYNDHSTSQEDKVAKLNRAQDLLSASVAAGRWR